MYIKSLRTFLAMSVFFLIMLCTVAAGRIIYVDADASGTNNGSSWADAYNYLQDALADANSATKPVEIRVAEGIYTPDSNSANPNGTGNREETFRLINGVTIRGSYAGFGAPDPNVRNINEYQTILSGDLNSDDKHVSDLRDLLKEMSRSENSYHVVTGSATDETAVLDGFTVSGGNADGSLGEANSRGAGMYNCRGSPMVNNCIFAGNTAPHSGGGGMHNHDSNSTITKCTFTGNLAQSGAGISCSWGGNPTIRNCTVSKNSAIGYGGGGICCERDSNPKIDTCRITENESQKYGGGIVCIYSSATITNCIINDNWAWSYGGGIQATGDSNGKSPRISNCLISANIAGIGGGGIECSSNSAAIINCTISDNSALQYHGGGIFCDGSSPNISNCLITRNWAYLNGGGIHSSGGSFAGTGPIISNCTIAANVAIRAGAGISCETGGSSPTVTNCILWGNVAPQGIEINLRPGSSSSLTVTYSDVRGGQASAHVYDNCTLTWGHGNIEADPCFVDANAGDFHLKSQAGRWDARTQSWTKDNVTSHCIDAGDISSPLSFEPFPNGGVINMGAYGGTAEASKSYFGQPVCETIIAGDINGDCKVDFVDFTIMIAHWLEDNTP